MTTLAHSESSSIKRNNTWSLLLSKDLNMCKFRMHEVNICNSQHAYAKVYGSIRVFKDEKAIVGTHIKKIEKFDEVTNHLLQVFAAHNIRTKSVLTVSF